jgi:hypothetical protein
VQVSAASGFYAPSIRTQDFYIQEDVRPSRSPDGQFFSRQHTSFGVSQASFLFFENYYKICIPGRNETPSSLSTLAKKSSMLDDLGHRTPHFGYTSEIREQRGVAPVHVAKTKDITSEPRSKPEDYVSQLKDSHDQASRVKSSSSTRSRQQPVCLVDFEASIKAHLLQENVVRELEEIETHSNPTGRALEDVLAAFERRIDKKIRVFMAYNPFFTYFL